MKRLFGFWMLFSLVVVPAYPQETERERLQESAGVLKEVLSIPDDIPQELLDRAECVAVIPSVKKVAIGIGGSYGRGALVCRSGKDFTGPWSAPAMFALEGGSIGLQLGGEATDYLLLVMNPKGAESIMGSKVKLGADASAAAGPKGRTASAATDIVGSHRYRDAGRDTILFKVARPFCRRFPGRLDPPLRRRCQQEPLWQGTDCAPDRP
ncbi:MAG: hypothetical protein H6Q05_4537 [Acidobacteria bacterium]|nr:hypothetical protein [Acidobacteriota bacterium]